MAEGHVSFYYQFVFRSVVTIIAFLRSTVVWVKQTQQLLVYHYGVNYTE